jgi:hypothetical protein
MASIAFVDNRRAEKLGWLNANSRQILAEADRLFAILNDPKARAVVEARRHPTAETGWRLLPAVSLALAFAARHAARGSEPATAWVRRNQRGWGDLASVAPAMVTVDLIVAELLTTHHYSSKGPK